MDNRTRVQIDCPHIIQKLLIDPTTEDEELGTEDRHGMVVTTFRTGTIDHDAGPLSRFWSADKTDQLESALTPSVEPKSSGVKFGLVSSPVPL
jgi:hypothetical protein